jgi:hypothetical protein
VASKGAGPVQDELETVEDRARVPELRQQLYGELPLVDGHGGAKALRGKNDPVCQEVHDGAGSRRGAASLAGMNRVTLKGPLCATRISQDYFADFRSNASRIYAWPLNYFLLAPEELLTVR